MFSKRDEEHVLEERVLEQHVVVSVAVAQLSAEPAAPLQIVDADIRDVAKRTIGGTEGLQRVDIVLA